MLKVICEWFRCALLSFSGYRFSFMSCFLLSSMLIINVQDAKSDRVRQLLKETEKYLQKLGTKLKDAKALSRHFEMEMEDGKAGINVIETDDIEIDVEDESDQAKVMALKLLL